MNLDASAKLLAAWGGQVDPELLVLALTHRSFAHENGNLPTNERLEFLGDAVLQIIVTEYLFRSYPQVEEGELAKMRAATVSQSPLAAVARGLELGSYLLLGVGEDHAGGRDKDSILSDGFEALIGATYLSSGLETTRQLVERHLRSFLRSAPERSIQVDWKTTLQEAAATLGRPAPSYEVTGEGPDHARVFSATARLGGFEHGQGQASSKKGAENLAAEVLVRLLWQENPQLGHPAGD